MKSIFTCLALLFCLPFALHAVTWEEYKAGVLEVQPQIVGWCSQEKSAMLLDFIHEKRPMVCVEIGTLAGASTLPILSGLNYLGRGIVYAIDAWDHKACSEGLAPEEPAIATWDSLEINMDTAYHFFMQWVSELKLSPYCVPLRLKAHVAAALFADQSIDMLYIDGNPSSHGTLQEVISFFPKVKSGGYIWINNALAPAKTLAVAFLVENCTWLREGSRVADCFLFKKP